MIACIAAFNCLLVCMHVCIKPRLLRIITIQPSFYNSEASYFVLTPSSLNIVIRLKELHTIT